MKSVRNLVGSITVAGAIALSASTTLSTAAVADDYVIDTAGAHASINFKVSHLGYSWLQGRFDKFEGTFSFDPDQPEAATIAVTIDTNSVNSNHAERDNHLRSADFLDVGAFDKATFVSKSVAVTGDKKALIMGDFTLRGVTKEIQIDAEYIGGGEDPWGGYRQGFTGTTSIALADYGISFDLGPEAREVQLTLHVEGIRQ